VPKPKLNPDVVRQKIRDKWTDQAIGAIFGISRQAIYQFRKKSSIPKVAGRLEKRNKGIRKMRASGNNLADIAKKYRLSLSQVHRIVKGFH
jgi:DNA-directed RNA polymerase specialized sigma subunit